MTTISDEDVLELRKAAKAGVRAAELAARFGVSRAYVYELAAGRARPAIVAAATALRRRAQLPGPSAPTWIRWARFEGSVRRSLRWVCCLPAGLTPGRTGFGGGRDG